MAVAALRRARRAAGGTRVGTVHKDGPGKTRTNAGELLRASSGGSEADGCITLDQFTVPKGSGRRLAYGTLKSSRRSTNSSRRNRPELSRDRRLKVDYERLIDDVLLTKGRGGFIK